MKRRDFLKGAGALLGAAVAGVSQLANVKPFTELQSAHRNESTMKLDNLGIVTSGYCQVIQSTMEEIVVSDAITVNDDGLVENQSLDDPIGYVASVDPLMGLVYINVGANKDS